MRNIAALFILTVVTMALISSGAHAAQRMSVGASIDHACKMKRGTFVVPAGQNATNFRVTLSSPWLPCGGVSTPTRMGVRIPGFFYRIQYYNGKVETLQGNLATLTLGPGTYTVEVPDGGINTTASISYELKGAGKPTPAAPAAGDTSGWGTISGEWTDPTVKSKAKIVQTGNIMTITNTLMWEGKRVTWTGSGTVSGNSVRFTYRYTGYKPEMWENGTMTLTRVSKKSLKGSWTTHSGKYRQNIMFVQTKSDDKPKKPATAAKPAPAPKKPAAKPAAPQKNPCKPGFVWRGGNECIPRYDKHEER